MDDDTILIRARAKVAGMQPGEVDRRPRERAQALIDEGYAVRVDALSDRLATERPTRNPSNQPDGTWGGSDRNPIPSTPTAGVTVSSPPPLIDTED